MRTPTTCLGMCKCELLSKKHLIMFATGVFVIKEFRYILFKMDNRTSTRDAERDNAMDEAVNDQLLGRLMDLERLTSILRLLQTVIVLLEWMIPLLEDIRISRNSRDILAMLKDNLMSLETELQYQSWELRGHILDRYHRALRGWREQ